MANPIYSIEGWFDFLQNDGIIAPEFFERTEWHGDEVSSLMTTVKATDTIGTAGLYNKLYGTEAVVQVLYSDQIFGVLSKIPYLKSGHRNLNTAASTSGGNVALGGSVPAGDQRTYGTAYTTPKLHAKSEDIALSYKMLEGKDELVSSDQLVRDMMSEWKDLIDRSLAQDFDTAASTNIETVDRLTASSVERTACGETAGDEDFMTIDRSASTWWNAYVDHGGVAGTETDRDLTIAMMEDSLAGVEPYARGPNGLFAYTWMTGFDTYWRVAKLIGPAFRREAKKMVVGINGLTTDPGSEYSERIATVMDHPLVKVNHIKQDTISRLYGINNDYSGIKILAPPMVVSTDDIHKTGSFFSRTTAAEWSELYTDSGRTNIKIRGLQ